MKIAFLSPLPPARTGVAHYASMVLPALQRRLEVEAFDRDAMVRYVPEQFEAAFYQLGNNPHHDFIYSEAMRRPGVAVLHDVVLHHLVVEMTLARGDEEAYVKALRASHGEAGAAWARGRAIGLHDELANFLLPASIEIANASRAVIVHNSYAARRLRSFGVSSPIHVVAHPYEPATGPVDRDALRTQLGFSPGDRVIGFFGFLTSAKRAEIVLEAFRIARSRDPRLWLLVVGEPAPNIDLSAIAGKGVITTGYVPDQEFGSYYAAADRLVNLRYPSAGETSGTLIRAFDAGKPVAVSDYAQFAELPDSCVTKIAFGEGEVEALARFFTRDIDVDAVAAAQREWLDENARLDRTVQGYVDALGGRGTAIGPAPSDRQASYLPIFPRVEITAADARGDSLTLTLRNRGDATLRASVYGQPAYRAIVKLFDGGRELQNRWLELPRDLRSGESAEISMRLLTDAARFTVRLYNALESVPLVGDTPVAEVEIVRV